MSETDVVDLEEHRALVRRFDSWGLALRPNAKGKLTIIRRYGNETLADDLDLADARAWLGAWLGLEPSPSGGEAA